MDEFIKKINDLINKLPFNRLAAKANIPIPFANHIFCGVVFIVLLMLISSPTASSSKSPSGSSAGGGSRSVNFGRYPTDYKLAYTSMLMRNAPSIRDLFGPDVVYVTSIDGFPATVKLESSNGTKDRFDVQWLFIANYPEGENVIRIQVTFVSHETTQMSYVYHIKVSNLSTGQITEQRAYGDAHNDAEVTGFFIGVYMDAFANINKFL